MSLSHLKLHTLRYFAAVCEEGSMIRAGSRLNVVPATISGQIRTLEEVYGVELFMRTPTGLVRTPAGDSLYEHCRPLLQNLRQIDQTLRDTSGIVGGHIRLGVMTSICRGILGDIITRFLGRYETVTLEITEGLSEELSAAVEAHEVDFSVCNPPTALRNLMVTPIVSDPCVIVTRTPLVDPGCLIAGRTLVAPTRRNFFRRKLDELAEQGFICPSNVVGVDGLGATLSLVRSGDFCTILPEVAVRAEPAGIQTVPIPPDILTSDIAILSSSEQPLCVPARLLADEFRAVVGAVPDVHKAA